MVVGHISFLILILSSSIISAVFVQFNLQRKFAVPVSRYSFSFMGYLLDSLVHYGCHSPVLLAKNLYTNLNLYYYSI